MPKAFNLVCTRCTDGNDAVLQRWYNDHAQLLMVSHELQGARLFQLKPEVALISYFCLYEFDGLEAFSAFDAGFVMQEVRDLSNAAVSRSSIEIVKRTQYERLLHRSWTSQHDNEAEGGKLQVSLLSLQGNNTAQATRWINDVLYQVHSSHGLLSAQVYATSAVVGAPTELFVLLQSAKALPNGWHDWQSPYAARPEIALAWQTQAFNVAQWLR